MIPATPADPVSPRSLFRAVALAEAVTWTLLILGMVGKYALRLGDWPVTLGGGVHGLVFLAYCAVVVMVWIDARWSARDGLLGLVAAVVPYATIPVERRALRRDMLPPHWRLRPAAEDGTPGETGQRERPVRPWERLLAALLARPVLATAVVGGAVVVLYVALLLMGPPVELSDS